MSPLFLWCSHKLNIFIKSCPRDETAAGGEMQYTDNVLLMMLEQEVAELKAFQRSDVQLFCYVLFLICVPDDGFLASRNPQIARWEL